jgi:hypothetical protein
VDIAFPVEADYMRAAVAPLAYYVLTNVVRNLSFWGVSHVPAPGKTMLLMTGDVTHRNIRGTRKTLVFGLKAPTIAGLKASGTNASVLLRRKLTTLS